MKGRRQVRKWQSVVVWGLGLILALLVSSCCDEDCGREVIYKEKGSYVPSYALVATSDYVKGGLSLARMDSSQGFPVVKEDDFGAGLSDPGGLEIANLAGRQLALALDRGTATVFTLDPLAGLAVLDAWTVGQGMWAENPQDIVVVNEDKAYVSRFGHDDLLIVNPQTGARLGNITFTGLATNPDGLARPADLVLAKGKVFVALQNLDAGFNFMAPDVEPGLIAVINPNTDQVIATITLPRGNPQRLIWDSSRGKLLVACAGLYMADTGQPLTTRSGLVMVSPDSPYKTQVVVSGEDAAVNGNIYEVSASAGHVAFILVASGFANADRALKVDLELKAVDTGYRYPALPTGNDDLAGLALTSDSYLVIGDRTNEALVVEDLLLGVSAGWIPLAGPPMSLTTFAP